MADRGRRQERSRCDAAAPERAHRVLLGYENVEDPVHAHELEHRSHLLRHAAQLQVAALGVQFPKAGNEGAQAGAVDEAQPGQIEHELGIGVEHRRHVALELRGVAGVELLHRHRRDRHVTDFLESYLHRAVLCTAACEP